MKTIRLLTIGNSFSNNALHYLEDIAAGTGRVRFEVGRVSLGGCSLEKHWNLAQYSAAHPEFRPYALAQSPDGEPVMANLRTALTHEPWDIVTLQQASPQSWIRESFQPYLGQLCDMARELAPQAEIMLHQTWAYRTDSPFLVENSLTQDIMHQRIEANYRDYGRELGCRVLPCGTAIQLARQAPGRQFLWPETDFDYRNSGPPSLPQQAHSFAVGWSWAIEGTPDGIPQMCLDPKHLSARGCYLAGCVWFSAMTGLPIDASTFMPDDIPPEDVAFLRGIATQAVNAGEE